MDTLAPEKEPRRIASLDGLRALSVSAVILSHASAHFPIAYLGSHGVKALASLLATLGVTTFFVISGYLITTLLCREYEKTLAIDLPGFYRRRVVRILPASLFYIAVVLVLGHPTLAQSIYALTFTTTYFFAHAYTPLQHLWSLSVEEQFYLLWPFIFSTGMRNAKRYCWLIMLACPFVRLLMLHYGYNEIAHCAPAIADYLAAGCLLAFYQEQVRKFTAKYFASTIPFLLLGIATVGISYALYRAQLVLLFGLTPCLLALIVSAAVERKDPVLNSRPLVWIGLLSYSLYLWQQPFIVMDGPFKILGVRLCLTVVMAYVSYRLVEQPMLRFRSPKPRAPKQEERLAANSQLEASPEA